MPSTLQLKPSDPHDDFSIAPDVVPVTWADKVLADIKSDAVDETNQPSAAASDAEAATAPTVDTTFRATAVGQLQVANDDAADPPSGRSWVKSAIMVFMFALCSAIIAASWRHYGDAASRMIFGGTPAVSSSPQAATAPAMPSETAAVATPAADQTAPPEPAANAVPAAATPLESAQLQSMARELAAMAQQIEQLKAGVADLKVSQQVTGRTIARLSESKASESKASESKASESRASNQPPRPKVSVPPPRSAAAAAPRPTSSQVQAAAPAPLPPPMPQTAPLPASSQAALPPLTVDQFNEPVVRPPMPLR